MGRFVSRCLIWFQLYIFVEQRFVDLLAPLLELFKVIVQFPSDFRCVSGGAIIKHRSEPAPVHDFYTMRPFDGKWILHWSEETHNSSNMDSITESEESTCIHVVSNQFWYRSKNLKIEFAPNEISETPFVAWTESDGSHHRFELCQSSYEFNAMSYGPALGTSIQWGTCIPNRFMIWVRKNTSFYFIFNLNTINIPFRLLIVDAVDSTWAPSRHSIFRPTGKIFS